MEAKRKQRNRQPLRGLSGSHEILARFDGTRPGMRVPASEPTGVGSLEKIGRQATIPPFVIFVPHTWMAGQDALSGNLVGAGMAISQV
jgi:hypothetical protein